MPGCCSICADAGESCAMAVTLNAVPPLTDLEWLVVRAGVRVQELRFRLKKLLPSGRQKLTHSGVGSF